MSERVVIVGGGQAGFQIAARLSQKGFTGAVLLLAAEPHLPYERPPLSKGFLKGETAIERLAFRPAGFYEERGIDLRLATRVEGIDTAAARVRTGNGEWLAYDALVLATGARIRRLKLSGAELPGIFYLRTIEEAGQIRRALERGGRLCIVGAGYIGLEVAAAARALGAEVTVLEAQDRVMARTSSPAVAAALTRLHERHGVDLRTGVAVEGFIARGGRAAGVVLEGGDQVDADAIVVGIGVRPETALAETGGLDAAGGIRVGAVGASSVEGIYAAGDCARYAHPLAPEPMVFESVQNAVDQASAVASALLGAPKPYEAVPWFWSDQYDARLQTAGLVAAGEETILRGDPASGKISVAHLRQGRLVALETLGRMKDFVQSKALIAKRARPDPAALADPDIPLKTLG